MIAYDGGTGFKVWVQLLTMLHLLTHSIGKNMKKGEKLRKDGCEGDYTDSSYSRHSFICHYNTITCWDCIYGTGRKNPQSKTSMSIPKAKREAMWDKWRKKER